MILPDGHETMTDEELVKSLVESGAYDETEAEDVVALLRGEPEERAVVD